MEATVATSTASPPAVPTPPKASYTIEVSADALKVTLKPHGSVCIPPAEILARLQKLNLLVEDTQKLTALAGPDGHIHADKELILLQGEPPVADLGASIRLLTKPKEKSIDFYDRFAASTAKAGEAVATMIPASLGHDGVNIYGKPIRHAKASAPVHLGKNVALDADGQTVRATAAGRVYLRQNVLLIETGIDVRKDVDFSTGHIEVEGDVTVGGSVLDLFKVSGSSIYVGAAVEAAELHAQNDIVVGGGIVGKDKGLCVAGNDIRCKYATNATLQAGGNITAHSELANIRISCSGRMTVEAGPIVSGKITANGGVFCQTLGSPVGSKLLVEVGMDDWMRTVGAAKLADINARKTKAAQIRATAETLLKNQKNLSAKQKEQATELLYDAAEAESTAAAAILPLRQSFQISQEKCDPQIVVREILYAGVTLRFPGVEATVDTDWKGPIRVVSRQTKGETRVFIVNALHGSVHPISSHPHRDEALELLRKTLAA